MSESQWAMPLAWVDVRLLAEGISHICIWYNICIIYIYTHYSMIGKTDHARKLAILWLSHPCCMVGIVRVCLTSRFKSRSSLFSWGWEPFALTAVCDSVAQQDMAEQSSMVNCALHELQKKLEGVCYMQRDWNEQDVYQEALQQGLSMLVHVLGYIVFEDIWVLSRTAGPAWTTPVQTTPLQRTVEDGGRHAWNRDQALHLMIFDDECPYCVLHWRTMLKTHMQEGELGKFRKSHRKGRHWIWFKKISSKDTKSAE